MKTLQSKDICVYIASPYTNGRTSDNVRKQLDAGNILMDHGYTPFIPLLSHYAEIHMHRGEHEWFEWDVVWLRKCDILIRIKAFDDKGNEIYSVGADEEVRIAKEELRIPVYIFENLEELKKWVSTYTHKNLPYHRR